MKFIRPTVISDAMLTSSDVPETDHALWNAATDYTLGGYCIRTTATTHKIYRNLIAGVNATPPEDAPTRWLAVDPTNRWAMFDEKLGTVTTQADAITVTLAPGRLNSLALLGLDAAEVSVSLVVDAVEVYAATIDLIDRSHIGNWYDYYYEPIYSTTEVVLTDLVDAALLDIPAYSTGTLTVTISRPGGTVSCGLMVVGLVTDIGTTLINPVVSIRDYSRKESDEFGNYVLIQRSFSKKMSAQVFVPDADVDRVVKEVSRHRATNVVWIGSSRYGCLVVFGFVTDWRLTIQNMVASEFNLEVEGMTS